MKTTNAMTANAPADSGNTAPDGQYRPAGNWQADGAADKPRGITRSTAGDELTAGMAGQPQAGKAPPKQGGGKRGKGKKVPGLPRGKRAASKAAGGGKGWNLFVFFAILLIAAATGLGLSLQLGAPAVVAVAAATAVFIMLISVHIASRRSAQAKFLRRRVRELEEELASYRAGTMPQAAAGAPREQAAPNTGAGLAPAPPLAAPQQSAGAPYGAAAKTSQAAPEASQPAPGATSSNPGRVESRRSVLDGTPAGSEAGLAGSSKQQAQAGTQAPIQTGSQASNQGRRSLVDAYNVELAGSKSAAAASGRSQRQGKIPVAASPANAAAGPGAAAFYPQASGTAQQDKRPANANPADMNTGNKNADRPGGSTSGAAQQQLGEPGAPQVKAATAKAPGDGIVTSVVPVPPPAHVKGGGLATGLGAPLSSSKTTAADMAAAAGLEAKAATPPPTASGAPQKTVAANTPPEAPRPPSPPQSGQPSLQPPGPPPVAAKPLDAMVAGTPWPDATSELMRAPGASPATSLGAPQSSTRPDRAGTTAPRAGTAPATAPVPPAGNAGSQFVDIGSQGRTAQFGGAETRPSSLVPSQVPPTEAVLEPAIINPQAGGAKPPAAPGPASAAAAAASTSAPGSADSRKSFGKKPAVSAEQAPSLQSPKSPAGTLPACPAKAPGADVTPPSTDAALAIGGAGKPMDLGGSVDALKLTAAEMQRVDARASDVKAVGAALQATSSGPKFIEPKEPAPSTGALPASGSQTASGSQPALGSQPASGPQPALGSAPAAGPVVIAATSDNAWDGVGEAAKAARRNSEIVDAVAVERFEFFVTPIHALEDRKARHLELSVKLLLIGGDLLERDSYDEVLANNAMRPLLDVAKLGNSAKLAERLAGGGKSAAVFAEYAGESMASERFLDELANMLNRSAELAGHLVLSFSQADVREFGDLHWDTVDTLKELGFRFSLEHITDLDISFEELKQHGFDFIKLDADVLLKGMPLDDTIVPAADLCQHLAEVGQALIVGHIDDEMKLAKIQGFGAVLGQGSMFGGARPVTLGAIKKQSTAAA